MSKKIQTLNDLQVKGQEHLLSQGEALNVHYTGDDNAEPVDSNNDDVDRLRDQKAQLEAFKNEIDTYNKNVDVLDPKYSRKLDIKGNMVLLRMRRKEAFTKNGIFIGQEKLPVQGQGGEPDYKVNPFSFELKGVVVNKGEGVEEYNVGDHVQVEPSAIKVEWRGAMVLPTIFYRWDAYNEVPEKIKDHYGYILIPKYKIHAKINKNV